MECYLYAIPGKEETLHLLSPLSREQLAGRDTRSEFFIGRLIDPLKGIAVGNISYNADFLVLVHSLVRDLMVNDPSVLEEAAKQPNGFVFIIDRRAKEDENIQKEDIIGIFLVAGNKTDISNYRPNPDYVLVSERSVGILPEIVEDALMKRLIE